MGEYAMHNGERVKIGTCEDMLYLRADQAAQVQPLHGNVNPTKDADAIRFRFPWPEEDRITPGNFDNPDRSVPVWGATAPEGVEHYRVQFVARVGYNLTIPCPESGETVEGVKVHRNGFGGAVRLIQQRVWNGHLAIVLACGGCDTRWRCEELADAQPVIDAIRAEAKRFTERDANDGHARWWDSIADRIEAGYTQSLPWQV